MGHAEKLVLSMGIGSKTIIVGWITPELNKHSISNEWFFQINHFLAWIFGQSGWQIQKLFVRNPIISFIAIPRWTFPAIPKLEEMRVFDVATWCSYCFEDKTVYPPRIFPANYKIYIAAGFAIPCGAHNKAITPSREAWWYHVSHCRGWLSWIYCSIVLRISRCPRMKANVLLVQNGGCVQVPFLTFQAAHVVGHLNILSLALLRNLPFQKRFLLDRTPWELPFVRNAVKVASSKNQSNHFLI